MAGSLENRIKQLEREMAVLRRELAQSAGRIAAPLAERAGWVLVVLPDGLSQGGTATAKVVGHDGADWVYPDRDDIEVTDYFLNVDESIPADTKAACMWYRSLWVLMIPYCAASDTLPESTSMLTESGSELTSESGTAFRFNVAPAVIASSESGVAITTETGSTLLMEA